MQTTRPVLIAYDGSDTARHAIDEAAPLLVGRPVVVAYARRPDESVAAHLEGHPAIEDVDETAHPHALDEAHRVALEGARLAREAGLDATAQLIATTEPAGDAVVHAAEQLDASLIVMGSRGRRELKALLLGSASHHVVQHAHRPVLVIPSPKLAAARRELAPQGTRAPVGAGPLG
jgi:nucleotide-binding universal stress UspA family protein